MNDPKQPGNPARRAFFRKSIPLIPVTALAATGGAATLIATDKHFLPEVPGPAVNTSLAKAADYHPSYFSADEYRFGEIPVIKAVAAALALIERQRARRELTASPE